MQIVIDIPRDIYEYVQAVRSIHTIDTQHVANAIFDDTPLPKGHGRLVDVSEYFKKEFGEARKFLDNATTIIEADGGEEE